jgi:glycine cleavage system aminomethyltransferase T
LRRLRFETDVVPNSGAVIYNEAGSQEVGIVTSAASGPGENTTETAGTVIALGLMKRSALSAGTALILKSGDTVAKGLVL